MNQVSGSEKEIENRIDELIAKVETILSGLSSIKSIRKEIAEVRQLVTAPRAIPIDGGLILAKLAFDNVLLAVEQEDRLIGPHIIMNGIYEKNLTAYMRRMARTIDTFVDVGANIGYHTCTIAKQIRDRGRVFAFEPDPKNYAILKRNTEINWVDKANIVIERLALSNSPGELTLYRHISKPGNTTLIQPGSRNEHDASGEIEEVSVPVSTLDDYFANLTGSIDVMKIDVEGYEFQVLQGGIETLRNSPNLHLVLEWDPPRWNKTGVSAQNVIQFMSKLSLTPFEIDRSGELIELSQDVLAGIAYANIVWKRPTD